ncbi:MAG: TAXI family TRAP transporter solute-binding subunit [Chloroflexi bacterium]|nr:TAXI family TRAP transporter solute-binding subunit [Chloroflexota bacterium]
MYARFLVAVVAVVLAQALVVSCGGASAPPAAPPTAAAPAQPAPAPAQPKAAPAQPAPAKPAAAAPAAGQKLRLRMGSTNATSSYYAYHVAEAKLLNAKVPEVDITVTESAGGAENIERFARGEFQLGLTNGVQAHQAYSGLGTWKDKARKELRIMWIYTWSPRAVIVRQDSGVKKLEDLEGKPFNPGQVGSGVDREFKQVAEVVGIKPRWYEGGTEDATQAIKDRRIVGYNKAQAAGKADSSTLDLMAFAPITLLSFTPEHVKKVLDAYPYMSFADIPAGWTHPNAPAWTGSNVSVGEGTFHGMIPDEIVYKMVKVMDENIESLVESFSAVKGSDVRKLSSTQATVPLHRATVRYLREKGVQVPEKLLPQEAGR